jgi:hypothetical protein
MERVRFVLSLADAQFALIQINSAAMWSTIQESNWPWT